MTAVVCIISYFIFLSHIVPTSNLCVLDFSPSGLCDWNSGYNNPGPNPQVNCWLIELTFGVFGIWDRVCCILFGIWNGSFGFGMA